MNDFILRNRDSAEVVNTCKLFTATQYVSSSIDSAPSGLPRTDCIYKYADQLEK